MQSTIGLKQQTLIMCKLTLSIDLIDRTPHSLVDRWTIRT